MIFDDPDVIRRVRAQSLDGKVRLCECVQSVLDDERDACEQLALDSRAYIASLAMGHGERELPYLDNEDIVQETMVKVLRDSTQFHGDTVQAWKGWLSAVRKRTILDLRRFYSRHRRQFEEPLGVHDGIVEDGQVTKPGDLPRTPDGLMSINEEYQRVLGFAEAHRPGSAKLLEDRFRFGLDIESLASRHACTPCAARRRLDRILRYLRDVLPRSPPPRANAY
jgi:DNA-directed RNA polymerase specialized sigma24 family protein